MSLLPKGDKSMFGPQVSSTKPTNPAYGFGTSGRTSSTKLLFTKEQTGSNVGLVSPGPIYDVPSSLGLQMSSKNNTAPAFKFGARSLSDSNLSKESRPGPGTYGYDGSMGKQIASQKNTSASWKFGSSNRWSNWKSDFKATYATPGSELPKPASGWLGDAAAFSFGTSGRHQIGQGNPGSKPTFRSAPGPGSYSTASSLGPQLMSQKKTSSQFKFGSATRDKSQKVYLTHAHEREYVGQHSPAPNAYTLKSSLGSQTSSKNQSSATFKFGTADRFSDVKARSGIETGGIPPMNPGPGSYMV
mmetsp:Transcript_22352/g.26915  ORF Transcript_22352/g.26915 Transcript_22352/m.26915 type:complete len:301 (-) Transcript_22352:531-1433(-)|eukprot:CAMPEP_0197849850 /NCGR_PEP_ID=MMETSP1438-20131217/13419_1 /TAXON_ID=1461541 /ORGANISM="Pterosperma sp., Strain CCMP1384" /LENGTH=300 /DNA_ID=CAMNT_0043462715 /DNA_START=270 /DNA_END=1172 /DNA_ORIENTATION=+